MTALKPISNRRVRGVAAERYPLNTTCAHPECAEPAVDPHHAFPRSAIGNDSWFVAMYEGEGGDSSTAWDVYGDPIPHVAGLCRAHHDAVERHDAWIKLEDGIFVWYDRVTIGGHIIDGQEVVLEESDAGKEEWYPLGPLDPQPAGRAKSHKKRRKLKGEARRKRKTISLRVPDDTEDGGAIWDETLEETKAKLVQLGLYDEGDAIPNYEAVIAGLRDWLNTGTDGA